MSSLCDSVSHRVVTLRYPTFEEFDRLGELDVCSYSMETRPVALKPLLSLLSRRQAREEG